MKTIRNTTISELKLEDAEGIQQVLEIENEAFNKGAIHLWVLAPFVVSQKVIVCRIDNEVVGMGIFLKSFTENEVFFFSFALKKTFQGQGFGKYFFKKTIDYIFQNFNCVDTVKLTVDPDIKRNIELFKKIGFKEIDFFEHFYGNDINRIFMELNKKNFYNTDGNF